MPILNGVEVKTSWRTARPNIGMALLAAPMLLVAPLIVADLARDTAAAALAGVPMGLPALLADIAVRSLVTYVLVSLGLLMCLGGTYSRLDAERRRVRSYRFYGFFLRTMECGFDDALQVALRAESSRPVSQRSVINDGQTRYHTRYLIELQLKDGRRMPLASGLNKERIHARGAEIAAALGVPVLDLGLVGRAYRPTAR